MRGYPTFLVTMANELGSLHGDAGSKTSRGMYTTKTVTVPLVPLPVVLGLLAVLVLGLPGLFLMSCSGSEGSGKSTNTTLAT